MIQAHDGGIGSPPNASALGNDVANPKGNVYTPVIRKLTAIRSGPIH